MDSFGCLGKSGGALVEQMTVSVVGGKGRDAIVRKGIVKECLPAVISVTSHVDLFRRVHLYRLVLRSRQEAREWRVET